MNDTVDKLVIFLAKRDGIDKLVKTFQYVSKLVHWHIEASHPSLAGRAKQWEVASGLSRKAFRTGRFLTGFNALRRNPGSTLTFQVLAVMANAGEMVYFFFDHFLWLSRIGVLDEKLAKRMSFVSAFGESFGYVFFVVSDLIMMAEGLRKERKLLGSSGGVIGDDGEDLGKKERSSTSSSIITEIKKKRADRVMRLMAVAANIADLIIALAEIEPNPLCNHVVTLGISGLVSAWAGAGAVPDNSEIQVDTKSERLKLAFHRAKDYRKNLSESNSVRRDSALQVRGISDTNGSRIDDSVPELEEDGKIFEAPGMAMDDKQNKAMTVAAAAAGGTAFEDKDNSHFQGDDNGKAEIPEALRIAMEKAKEYKKNKGMPAASKATEKSEKIPLGSGSETGYGNVMRNRNHMDKPSEKKELKISSIDFMGLDFSEKKNRRGLPPGLLPVADPYAYGEMPEVEIIVGDRSKFDNMQSAESENASEDTSNSYKPKVSTWGVFPRPSNISKTFGGGRNLRPGEALETPEDRAAKEARTRKLLAEYKTKIGLDIDPKLKAECKKNLREGDALMDIGKLKEALPYYQKVMDNLVFQSELYGLAALQWSICQDSLSRPDEALAMYKRLKSHSNAQVSKKARQFVSSFEAMDMMKVRRAAPINPGYQPYFQAFIEEKTSYSQEKAEEEGSLSQAFPYLLFLASPIVIVLLFAVKKGI